jgi:HAE1 family hydrophobic/amphiphilic exporter-1
MGSELLPNLSQGRFTIETSLPVGTPLSENLEMITQVEDIANNHPDIATAWTVIGAERGADTRSDEGPHTARVLVELESHAVAEEERVKAELRRSLSLITGLNQQIRSPTLFSFRTPIEVIIQSDDLSALQEVSDLAVSVLSNVDGLDDVHSSLSRGFPELRVVYRRELLERHGLSAADVATSLRNQVQGVTATRIRRGNRSEDLLVRLQEGDRSSSREIENINVNPQVNPPIPLSSVAYLEPGVGPSEIRRVDQVRVVVVEANLTGFDLGSGGERVFAALSQVQWPPGVTWHMAGQQTEMERSTASMKFAIGMAVFLVYIIMASTFESLVHPFVILMSLPLALVGVVLALLPLGVPLSVVVMIGLIVLAGVVVNNAIVLVDTINRLRDSGLNAVDAIEKAAAMRLRPIVITTATTVLGLMPLALGGGQGGELQQPLALTLISGLLVSTLLTLVVIPVVYQLFAVALDGEAPSSSIERSPSGV